jgi:hypothetical protein
MVTENIPVKRELYKQIHQQSTNMKCNQFAVASRIKTARARLIDRKEYEKIIFKIDKSLVCCRLS